MFEKLKEKLSLRKQIKVINRANEAELQEIKEEDCVDLTMEHKTKIIIVYSINNDRFKIFYDKEKVFTYLKNQYKLANSWGQEEEETYKMTKESIIDLGEDSNLAVTFKTIKMECLTNG